MASSILSGFKTVRRICTGIFLLTAFSAIAGGDIISINDGWRFRLDKDSTSHAVNLPHSWNTDAYHNRNYYRGKGIYTRSIEIPGHWAGKTVYLRLDGAATSSEIFIDGEKVGGHIGAYSSHTLDITPYISGERHELTVEVRNNRADIAPFSADFTFMGGLYRDAWLIAVPLIHLDIANGPECGFKTTPFVKEDGEWALEVSAEIVNESDAKAKIFVEASVVSADGVEIDQTTKALTLKVGERSRCHLTPENLSDVKLWSPEEPNLYTVEVRITDNNGQALGSYETTTGFRSFCFDSKNRFILNGKPYKLRGMCRHQDQAPMGIALDDTQHRRDMALIKETGANFIRISHYPQDDAILEMCDRLGLIVWEEIPVIDFVPATEAFDLNCETMLREMILRHYNHPSIAMWGYMNEILLRMPSENQDETKKRTLTLAKHLEDVLHEEDSSRLSTMAFHGSDIYHSAGLSGITDVKGWNLYQGWYGGRLNEFEEFLSRQHHEHPEHPLIVSEYGAGSDLRLHSLAPEPFDFSIEYQQDYLEHYLPVIEDSIFIAGAAHWNFIDFSSANRAESMPHINNKGIVTNSRRKKDVFYYYKAVWHNRDTDTVAHIATRDWAERTDISNGNGSVIRPIKIYTNLPEVTLRVNGQPQGVKTVENCTAIFDVELRHGTNILELLTSGLSGQILDATTVNLMLIPLSGNALNLCTEELAINVGSNCYYHSPDNGLTWLPDREWREGEPYGYTDGFRASSQDDILLTDDDPLLQHCILDLSGYHIAVVPGKYEIELLFADLSTPSSLSAYMLGRNAGSGISNSSIMDIYINGKQVERDFAPALSNGVKSMVKKRYQAKVTDNNGLSLRFTPKQEGGHTSLSAIKIRKLQ